MPVGAEIRPTYRACLARTLMLVRYNLRLDDGHEQLESTNQPLSSGLSEHVGSELSPLAISPADIRLSTSGISDDCPVEQS